MKRVHKDTRDTFSLELEPENGDPFSFLPGQFNMLYLFGTGEVPISISGDPGQTDAILHTVRRVGVVTDAMGQLRKGHSLGLRGPYGEPWPLDQAENKDIVIVAGGIGLAPLRPALLSIVANRDKYQNIVLLYGARTPDDILYRKDLEKLSAQLDIQVFVTVDRGTANWRGSIGVVPNMIRRAPFDAQNAVAMICGPEIMIHYATKELHRRGLPDEKIFVSMERNMKCGIGLCGHCQFGPYFVCRDGPVFPYSRVEKLLQVREA
ncbi:Oxidoreductase NAD-binding domain protein [Verrucomicrobiia bacterium DG1235]|nr:Oxidoreductase NAD-binding domain protein [Verrucomicrobiae bacterium DG1235]